MSELIRTIYNKLFILIIKRAVRIEFLYSFDFKLQSIDDFYK